jgi:HEAT repeat protein
MKILRNEFLRGKGGNMSKNYAAIALGRVGGAIALKTLKNVAIKEKSQNGVYAAIGLGMLADHLSKMKDDEKAGQDRINCLNTLRTAFKKCNNPGLKGGFAIAIGIARDREAGPLLLQAMKRSQTVGLRGYLAISMGMIGYKTATEYLVNVMVNADNLPLLKQQVAIGLGLMGNRQVARKLVKQMKESSNAYVTTSISKALGFVGDRDTVPPLVKMMTDEDEQDITRAYATLALGTIGDDAQIPVLSDFFVAHNYLASTQTLSLLQRIMNS